MFYVNYFTMEAEKFWCCDFFNIIKVGNLAVWREFSNFAQYFAKLCSHIRIN